MNTAKIYYDSEDNECTINQMVRREPEWAANIIQWYEAEIAKLKANPVETVAEKNKGHKMKAKQWLEEKGIHPTEPIYWDTGKEIIHLNELMDEFAGANSNRLEKQGYTSEAVQKGGIDEIVNNICKELHEDSEIEIKIEAGYAGITLYHKLEKIGDYDTSESLPTIADVLEYVIGREKHLH